MISLGFREFRNNCVSCNPVSMIFTSDWGLDALVENIQAALSNALKRAAEAIFQPKVTDAQAYVVVSDGGKDLVSLDVDRPENWIDLVEDCLDEILARFIGVVFVSRDLEVA